MSGYDSRLAGSAAKASRSQAASPRVAAGEDRLPRSRSEGFLRLDPLPPAVADVPALSQPGEVGHTLPAAADERLISPWEAAVLSANPSRPSQATAKDGSTSKPAEHTAPALPLLSHKPYPHTLPLSKKVS